MFEGSLEWIKLQFGKKPDNIQDWKGLSYYAAFNPTGSCHNASSDFIPYTWLINDDKFTDMKCHVS